MAWHFPTYLILSLFLTIISLVLAILAWGRRGITGNQPLAWLMLTNTSWLIIYVCGIIARTTEIKYFWQQAQYPFILSIPAISVAFLLQFTGQQTLLSGKRWLWVWIEPLVGILLVLTNPLHHLVWKSMQYIALEGYTHIETIYGPWSWFHLLYASLLASWGAILLLRYTRRAPAFRRSQANIIFACFGLTFAGILLDLLAPPILHGITYTSLMLLLCGMGLVTMIDTRPSRNLLPLARDAILENMSDGVIILDPHDQIVDLNHTASELLGKKLAEVIGLRLETVWPAWPAASLPPEARTEVVTEVLFGNGDTACIFDLRLTPILDKQGHITGHLAILRDITRRKTAEEAIQRRDLILQAVSYAAEQFLKSGSWDQDIQEVLARLGKATQVCRVYLFENISENGSFRDVLRAQWVNREVTPDEKSTPIEKENLAGSGFTDWIESLSEGQAVSGLASELPDAEQTALANENIQSIAIVPIFVAKQWWGYIGFDDCQSARAWSSVEMDALRAAAGTLGAAIERSRLVEQSQDDAAELTALYQASTKLLHAGRDLQSLAERITASVMHEFAYTACSLRILDHETRSLKMLAYVGFPDGHYPPLPLDGESVVATAARLGQIVYVPDVSRDPRYLNFASATRSQLAFPLLVEGRVIGVLNMENPNIDGFDQRAQRILANYADNAALAVQNVLLFNQAEARAHQLAQLNEITRTAIASYGFKETLKKLADNLVDLLGSDVCFINLWDNQQRVIIPGAASGQHNQRYQALEFKANDETMTGKVLNTGQPLYIPDLQHSEHVNSRAVSVFQLHTVLAVPMVAGKQKLGSIIFGFREHRPLTEAEIKLSAQFADQVGLAISKAWALEVAHQRAQEADNLRQSAAAVNSSLELTQVLDSILERLEPVVHYDSACVFLREGDHLQAVAGRGLPENSPWLDQHYPLDDLFLHTETQKQPIIIGDAQQDARFQKWGGTAYVRGWMGVPLVIRERVIGLLTMDSRQPDTFNRNHARLVAAFAGQVAIAIENARLYEEAKTAAEGRSVLHRVSQEVVTASFDPEQVYSAVHRAAAQLMPADAFMITLLDEQSGELMAVYLIDRDQRRPVMTLSRTQGLGGMVLSTGQSLILVDAATEEGLDNGFHANPHEHTRSVLAVPLRSGERVIGMLSAQSYTAGAYTTEDLHLLEMLAAYAAVAIENSRLMKQVQWLAITDPLTGLFNRRGLFDLGQREVERYRRFGRQFVAIMIDIDLFKKVNDAYGHNTGDRVLVLLADELRKNVRSVDVIGRYGGEEIVILLPETDLDSGLCAAERLRLAVEKLQIPTDHGPLSITISLGVAEFTAGLPNLATLVDQADNAMYQAKQAGRNRVCAYQ